MLTNDEKSAKLAAIQSQLHYCRNLLAMKEKSKLQSTVIKHRSLHNAHTSGKIPEKVPSQTNSNGLNKPVKFLKQNLSRSLLGVSSKTLHSRTVINKTNVPVTKKFINQQAKFLNQTMLQSSENVSINAVHRRTVVHGIKIPVSEPFVVDPQKLSVKPVVKNSAMSWTPAHKYVNFKKEAVPYKMANVSVEGSFSSSSVSKSHDQKNVFEVNISASSLNVKLEGYSESAVKNQSLQSIDTLSKKGVSKSQKVALCKKLDVMIEQLKQANRTISAENQLVQARQNAKLGTSLAKKQVVSNKFLDVSLTNGHSKLETKRDVGNVYKRNLQISSTLQGKRTIISPSGSVAKCKQLIPLQSTDFRQNAKSISVVNAKLEKTVESRSVTCIKPFNELEKMHIVVPKNPIRGVKRKISDTKLTPLRSGAIDCRTWRTNSSQINASSPTEVKIKKIQLAHQGKVSSNQFKSKAKIVNSKYKVVNKSYSTNNSLKSPFSKSLITSKPIVSRKRNATFVCARGNKKLMVNKFGSASKSSPVVANGQFSNKLYLKASAKKSYKPIPFKKSKVHSLNSITKSKYKIINETQSKSCCKVSKDPKPSSKTLFNFSTDVDLLMELAAEQNSFNSTITKPSNRSVLFKRLYKSKNTIINKNVSSARVKTANMIKSKYFASNKKHLCHKQGKSRNFSKFGPFQGGLKSFHGKFHSASFYNPRRNHSKHKITNYGNAPYFSRNIKRVQYPQNKLSFGAFKKYKRISGSRAVFSKVFNVKKISTPVSQRANRALQHSIYRVRTASVKKKVSKVDTYCMFYNRFGRCNKGTKCTYVHDPSKIAICTRFLRGTCKSENCLFSHEVCPGKMAICSFFLSGSCTKDNCPYRHEMIPPGTELCKAFVKGYCPDGKECKKAHVLVCPEYVKGSCSKGDACAFPHPPPKEKKIIEKAAEKIENVDNDDFLMESVSRYFQTSSEETPYSRNQVSSNLVVPKRKKLPEQPSFLSLSVNDGES